MSPHPPTLAHRLRAMAPLPFSTFMEKALFDPDAGYYSQNIATIGRRGDFSTTSTLSPSLSQAIAGWLQQCWRDNNPLPRTIIEIGAGDGSLAQGIIRHLGVCGRRKLHYHIVEISPPLRKQQLSRLGNKRKFQWHLDMIEALESAAGKALIISNELVDAFPAELLQWNADEKRWHDILLGHDGTQWITIPGSPVELPAASSLHGTHDFENGQRVERHDSYLKWLVNWLPSWHLGEMLTIDYGNVFPEIYHRRPEGTLRAYFAQQRLESLTEILSRPGKQDLTADVDFSDLRTRTAQLGLREIAFQTQVEFIAGQQVKVDRQDPAINPHGAGNAFKVLWQRRCRAAT